VSSWEIHPCKTGRRVGARRSVDSGLPGWWWMAVGLTPPTLINMLRNLQILYGEGQDPHSVVQPVAIEGRGPTLPSSHFHRAQLSKWKRIHFPKRRIKYASHNGQQRAQYCHRDAACYGTRKLQSLQKPENGPYPGPSISSFVLRS
jgi:hypothetical protein